MFLSGSSKFAEASLFVVIFYQHSSLFLLKIMRIISGLYIANFEI